MKNKFLIVAAIFIALCMAEASAESAIMVTDYTIYPEVFMPNDIGTIKVTVKNAGDTSAGIQQVRLYAPGFESITGIYSSVGSLGAGQSTTFTFAIKAPGSDGTYSPEVWIDVGSAQDVRYPVSVQIDSSDVSIVPSNIPSTISSEGGRIELNIANLRSNQINSVIVTPEADGVTFTPYEHYVGNLKPGNSSTVAFDMVASKSGQKDLTFEVSFKNGDNTHEVSEIVSVLVEVEPQIDVSLHDETVAISQGESELRFVLANKGDNTIKDIEFSWVQQEEKIVPVGSSNKKYISSIDADEEAEITYLVAAKSGIELGVYPLTVSLIYTDINSLRRNQTSEIGVFVGGITQFDVSLQEMRGGTTTLSIANIGINPAYSVVIKIPQQIGFVTTGSTSVAMGGLNADDYTFASFQITQMNVSGRQTEIGKLTVEVQYTDATGARRSDLNEIELDSSGTGTGSRTPMHEGTGSPSHAFPSSYIATGGILIVLIVLLWKRKKIAEYLRRKQT